MKILFWILWFLIIIGGATANLFFGNNMTIPYFIGFVSGTASFACLRLTNNA